VYVNAHACGRSCGYGRSQPRRISAIGLAERVAAERAEECGDSVGYSVRMQHRVGKNTRLMFVTTGILLRRLTFSPTLPDVSHIIIDEVHERSVEIDFLLVILKQLLAQRKDMRVILMSATLNADTFSGYFGRAPMLSIPGRTFPVHEHYLEDIIERSGYIPQGFVRSSAHPRIHR
jgi:HrpA-like RNA helicase